MLFVIGDFNAKVGKRSVTATGRHDLSCCGAHSRGRRNYSGQVLTDFASDNHLFACNTAFQHRAAHITTWTGWRHNPDGGSAIPIYNQIDYIFCRNSERSVVEDARSYAGTKMESHMRGQRWRVTTALSSLKSTWPIFTRNWMRHAYQGRPMTNSVYLNSVTWARGRHTKRQSSGVWNWHAVRWTTWVLRSMPGRSPALWRSQLHHPLA